MPLRLSTLFIGLLIFLPLVGHTQTPRSDQEWFPNQTLSNDTLTISCSKFNLPIDLGRLLVELDPINLRTGEMSQSMSSPHPVKVTLLPQAGTADNLSTISGCAIDGVSLYIKTQNSGDTITITESGNVNPPGTSITLDSPDDLAHLILFGSTWYVFAVQSTGGGGGSGSALIIRSQTLTSDSDAIDCDTTGPAIVRLNTTAPRQLSSNPQILSGVTPHLCTLQWTELTPTDTLTILDGNGVEHIGDIAKTFAIENQSATYYWTGSVWQELGVVLPGTTYTFPGGVPTITGTQDTTQIRIVDTEFIPISWCNDDATPPSAVTEHSQIDYRNFDPTTSEGVLCAWQIPEDIDESIIVDEVKVQAISIITNASAPATNEGVSWGFAACGHGLGDTVDCVEETEVFSETPDLGTHVQWDMVMHPYVSVTLGANGVVGGEFARIAVRRAVADADDDYAQDVGLVGFMIKFFRRPGSIDY